VSGLALSKSQGLERICSVSGCGPDGLRVMTAPAALASVLLNAAAPGMASARVRFGDRAERPCSKQYWSAPAEHTVVFLHGLCLNQTSWERQITYLLRRYKRSVRVLSYDHRGHRGSAASPAWPRCGSTRRPRMVPTNRTTCRTSQLDKNRAPLTTTASSRTSALKTSRRRIATDYEKR
jgi:pimeloyl-ACP methyl ester carboxylesterase